MGKARIASSILSAAVQRSSARSPATTPDSAHAQHEAVSATLFELALLAAAVPGEHCHVGADAIVTRQPCASLGRAMRSRTGMMRTTSGRSLEMKIALRPVVEFELC